LPAYEKVNNHKDLSADETYYLREVANEKRDKV